MWCFLDLFLLKYTFNLKPSNRNHYNVKHQTIHTGSKTKKHQKEYSELGETAEVVRCLSQMVHFKVKNAHIFIRTSTEGDAWNGLH